MILQEDEEKEKKTENFKMHYPGNRICEIRNKDIRNICKIIIKMP